MRILHWKFKNIMDAEKESKKVHLPPISHAEFDYVLYSFATASFVFFPVLFFSARLRPPAYLFYKMADAKHRKYKVWPKLEISRMSRQY